MTVTMTKDWRTEFGVVNRKPPSFFGAKEDLDTSSHPVPQAHAIRRAFDRMELDGVLCLQNSPLVYFKEVDRIQPQQVRLLQRRFWNQGLAPILVLIDPQDVHIYSGLTLPPDDDDDIHQHHRLVRTLNRVTEAAELRHFVLSVESGEFFRRHEKSFDPKQRVDRYLLRNLKAAREKLAEASESQLDPHILDALLCRLVFTCYLFDRRIIGESYLRSLGIFGAANLRDVLKRPRQEARSLLYALFKRLGEDFNGDLYSDDLDEEASHILEEHLEVLDDFLQGTNIRTGQRAFWPYDFSIIPIETISAIYDRFLKAGDPEAKRRSGAFYTPRFLAEIVLDVALEGFGSLLNRRFLDPACGSGIFLVGLFNQLAEEWRRNNSTARYDQHANGLMDILRNNLFGIDHNPTACRITAFSLYLTMLDQLSSPEIQRLRQNGNFLPRLVCTPQRNDSTHAGHTILCSDFFAEDTSLPKDFDLVVGNPPWESLEGGTQPAEQWCIDRNLPVPNRQLAVPFIWKATEHQRPGGRVCFVLPQGVLFNHQNKALEFQRNWITRHTVEVVLNLADYQRFLFEDAESPALVIRYRKEAPSSYEAGINYMAPKTDWSVARAEIITIPPEDRSIIKPVELLVDLNRTKAPLAWKQRFWGSPRDCKLLDRLALFPRLADIVGQARDRTQKRWIIAEGFQPLGSNDDVNKGKQVTLPTGQFIEASAPSIDLFLLESDCRALGTTDLIVRRQSNALVFRAPHVLVSQGLKVAYTDFDVVFRHALRGIAGPEQDREFLMFLAAYLRSPVARYFLFHTSGRWGIERSKVHVAELLRVPFFLPEQRRASARRTEIVQDVAALIQRAVREAQQPLANRASLVQTTQENINPLIYEYFDIDEVEQILIEDTLNVILPSIRPSRASEVLPTLHTSTAHSREAYTRVLCDTLNDWAHGGPYHIQGHVRTTASSGVGMVILERRQIGNENEAKSDDASDVLAVLDRLQKTFKEKLGSIDIARGVKVFDGNVLYIIKPLSQRFWTRTAALNDADAIAASVLSHIVK